MADPREPDDRRPAADPADDSPASAGDQGDAGRNPPQPPAPSGPGGTDDETIEDFEAPAVAARDAPGDGGGGDDDHDGTIEDFPSPALQDYNPAEDRERIRGNIALILVWALVGVLAFAVFSSWIVMTAESREALIRILEIALAPLVALVGAVTGFYFGEKSNK